MTNEYLEQRSEEISIEIICNTVARDALDRVELLLEHNN